MFLARKRIARRGSRRAVTLLELLLASMISAMIVGALASLAVAVNASVRYAEGYGSATQHARVTLERINKTVQNAASTTENPGAVVLADVVDSDSFPDTLVVWRADANENQVPEVEELTIFCPNPSRPNELWELTIDDDARSVDFSNLVSLTSIVDGLKASSAANKATLTTLVRTALPSVDESGRRAAVRFVVETSPSAAEWQDYLAGNLAWNDLTWAQGIHGESTGMRQTWVRYELQLYPTQIESGDADRLQSPAPFLGSATLYSQLKK